MKSKLYNKSDGPTSRIVGIQFSMMSPEEIRRAGVVQVDKFKETYQKDIPVQGGLFDPCMGVMSQSLICPTDGLTYMDSPGYPGYIELAAPVFHLQHMKHILKICAMHCYFCGKHLLNKEKYKHIQDWPRDKKWAYLNKVMDSGSRYICGKQSGCGCGAEQPKYIQESILTIRLKWGTPMTTNAPGINDDPDNVKYPEDILRMLQRISDEDMQFVGFDPVFSRPEWMICTVLHIAPPTVRPSVKMDVHQRSEDDLTHIYMHIIKTNQQLAKSIALSKSGSDNLTQINAQRTLLQYYIIMLINNNTPKTEPLAHRSGRPYQCIKTRVNSKNGRIRGNLMGKRVNYCARSVITGDPNLSIREVGIPKRFAMVITKPVPVTLDNMPFLTNLVRNGPNVYPGAKTLVRSNGMSIKLEVVDRTQIQLQLGDVVMRHIMDGDMVLFNRQPSLHRMSMMGHIARIMEKGNSFRMNLADTKPYNADYDGDEMNMHFPQDASAEVELRELACIVRQIISPTDNSPIIGIFQDSMLGSYLLSRESVTLTPRQAMGLLSMFPNIDPSLFRQKKITGRDILSQILPKMTIDTGKTVKIRNGVIEEGQLTKSALNGGTTGIIHRIHNDFGANSAGDFIDNLQHIVTQYITDIGFSVGVSDLVTTSLHIRSISDGIVSKLQEVKELMMALHTGTLKNKSTRTNADEFEFRMMNILNKINTTTNSIASKNLKENRVMQMVDSGAKGSAMNISQMLTGIEQQSVEGKRIPYGFTDRTLPHFTKFDDSPEARGYIANSYTSGLQPHEVFFHAVAGRVGLIDTAVKTKHTGYIQHRLVKFLENILITYAGTVVNNTGQIIQYRYGDDGFNPVRCETQELSLALASNEDIYLRYDVLGASFAEKKKDYPKLYSADTVKRLASQRNECRTVCSTYIQYMLDQRENIMYMMHHCINDTVTKDKIHVQLPISFHHTILNVVGRFQQTSTALVDLTPLECFRLVESYYQKLECLGNFKPTLLFKVMYFYNLCPRELFRYRMNKAMIIHLLETIHLLYAQSIAAPGETVGIIAGQSIGEPSTQMTLNTFHSTGVSSNVTLGVPRLDELIRITESPKMKSATVYIEPTCATNVLEVKRYSNLIGFTKLADVVKTTPTIIYDATHKHLVSGNMTMDQYVGTSAHHPEDVEFMREYFHVQQILNQCANGEMSMETGFSGVTDTILQSPWMIRMELDPAKMLERNITMDDIYYALENGPYAGKIGCEYSDTNAERLVFRIYIDLTLLQTRIMTAPDETDPLDHQYKLKTIRTILLEKTILRGFDRIKGVQVRPISNLAVFSDKGRYEKKEGVYIVDTNGSNLIQLLGLDYVDSTRTISNFIPEIFSVLGKEAARQQMLTEIQVAFSDVYINYHHLSVLCDNMCSSEQLKPVFRSGVMADRVGPISKSSFETHLEVLMDSSRHALLDPVTGVSATTMLGQRGHYGTNYFKVLMNPDVLHMKSLARPVHDLPTEVNSLMSYMQMNGTEVEGCGTTSISNNIRHLQPKSIPLCEDAYTAVPF
jgi:DNA-directed RNA polymerase II subunit RPB1